MRNFCTYYNTILQTTTYLSSDQQSELLLQSEKELVDATEKSEELRRKIEDAPAERERELKKVEEEVERSRKMVEKMRKKFDDNEEVCICLLYL